MERVCFICSESLNRGKTTSVTRGLQNLIAASLERKDNLHEKLEGCQSIELHEDCRKTYTRKSSIAASLRSESVVSSPELNEGPSKTVLRSSLDFFDFKSHCLFCGEQAILDPKKPLSARKVIVEVQTFQIRVSILNRAEKRSDDWGKTVGDRIRAAHDLVAAEARYHNDCYKTFFKEVSDSLQGRPQNAALKTAFESLCEYLENAEDRQHLVSDLISILNRDLGLSERYVKDFLKSNLQEKFGDRIFLFKQGKRSFVLLADCSSELNDQWYVSRKSNSGEEKKRILDAAINIVRREMLLFFYDKQNYPSSDCIKTGGESLIPENLLYFISGITKRRKRDDNTADIRRKRINISHALIAACRPRTFLSPIHCALGLYLSRCFGSRHLIDLLNNLGVCCSYKEVEIYQSSLISAGRPVQRPGSFSQFVFDNADINVRTLDGHDTFHAMGGIECITPANSVTNSTTIIRKKSTLSTGHFNIPVTQFIHDPEHKGLKKFTFIDCENQSIKPFTFDARNLLWFADGINYDHRFPGWHGFMHSIHNKSGAEYETSYILALPFINLDPGNLTCVNSALHFASQQALSAKKQCALVTFDQPLYLKAMKIVADDEKLSNIEIRLGGFHLLLSFLGCMGKFMEGSGIEDLWGTVYGKATIKHLLSGHAYSRSYRAHMMTAAALIESLCEKNAEFGENLRRLSSITQNCIQDNLTVKTAVESEIVKDVSLKLSEICGKLKEESRTAKLWLQELTLVDLLFRFILAERTGNWQLHLDTVKDMLPYFQAAGHFNYAKSGQLYLQQMIELEKKMSPAEFNDFTKNGFFTIRRIEKYFTGTWSDMTIEQSLMRSIKSMGGLIHGRGLSEKTLSTFILCAPAFLPISEALQLFSGTLTTSSEQHVELRDSRKKRDLEDIKKFVNWLKVHPPFQQEKTALCCISTGLVAGNDINCDDAFIIGKENMKKMIGKNFEEVTMQRKFIIKPIAASKNGVSIRSETKVISAEQVFNRVISMAKGTPDFKKYFAYELSPYPSSMFDNNVMMKKNTKSDFTAIFASGIIDVKSIPSNHSCVIDGGYLMNAVLWPKPATFQQIIENYVNFVIRQYGSHTTIVFDGYPDYPTTKSQEQLRRVKKTSANIIFHPEMQCIKPQSEFLANSHNKKRLILMLIQELQKAEIETVLAAADADRDIVTTAISKAAKGQTVIVVGTDTDLIVLLVTLSVGIGLKIFFRKPRTKKKSAVVYDIASLREKLKSTVDNLFFAYAITGCDTTSALYKVGKMKAHKLLSKSSNLRQEVLIFNEMEVDKEDLCKVGENFLLHLYGGEGVSSSLDQCRYIMYMRKVAKMSLKSKFEIATLPPTSSAAQQHLFRVYYQVQLWLGNTLDPKEWGWKEECNEKKMLLPVHSTLDFAPEVVVKMVSCNCKKECNSRCKCVKAGLLCSEMCGHCSGVTCQNVPPLLDESALEEEIGADDL